MRERLQSMLNRPIGRLFLVAMVGAVVAASVVVAERDPRAPRVGEVLGSDLAVADATVAPAQAGAGQTASTLAEPAGGAAGTLAVRKTLTPGRSVAPASPSLLAGQLQAAPVDALTSAPAAVALVPPSEHQAIVTAREFASRTIATAQEEIRQTPSFVCSILLGARTTAITILTALKAAFPALGPFFDGILNSVKATIDSQLAAFNCPKPSPA